MKQYRLRLKGVTSSQIFYPNFFDSLSDKAKIYVEYFKCTANLTAYFTSHAVLCVRSDSIQNSKDYDSYLKNVSQILLRTSSTAHYQDNILSANGGFLINNPALLHGPFEIRLTDEDNQLINIDNGNYYILDLLIIDEC